MPRFGHIEILPPAQENPPVRRTWRHVVKDLAKDAKRAAKHGTYPGPAALLDCHGDFRGDAYLTLLEFTDSQYHFWKRKYDSHEPFWEAAIPPVVGTGIIGFSGALLGGAYGVLSKLPVLPDVDILQSAGTVGAVLAGGAGVFIAAGHVWEHGRAVEQRQQYMNRTVSRLENPIFYKSLEIREP